MVASSDKPAAGHILAGKYRIDKIIGEGAMGYVLGAFHLELEESIAIKWVRDVEAAGPQAIERFLREAKLCAKLQSEHVVRVRDVARTETGTPFIVMELLEGHDLAALVADGKGIAAPLAVDYVIEACEAVAEAHQLGIVHRDLKLQNLFLARRKDGSDLVKVLDFGISKVTSSASLAMTAGTAILGSPLYMSPEQWRSSKDVDARSDIWSLGVVLFELLTGHVPFIAESLPELCMQIMSSLPLAMSGFAPEVPPALEQVVLACLAKDPAQRPSNVGAFARALAPFATPRSRSSLDRIQRLQPDGNMPPPLLQALPSAPSSAASSMHSRTLVTEPHLRPPPPAATGSTGEGPVPPGTGEGRLQIAANTMPNWAASQAPTRHDSGRRSKGALALRAAALVVVLGAGAFGVSRALDARDGGAKTEAAATPVASAFEASSAPVDAPEPQAPAGTATSASESNPRDELDAGEATRSPKVPSLKVAAPPIASTKPKVTPKPTVAPGPGYTAPAASAPPRDLGGSRR